jgi:hypothetical protein
MDLVPTIDRRLVGFPGVSGRMMAGCDFVSGLLRPRQCLKAVTVAEEDTVRSVR